MPIVYEDTVRGRPRSAFELPSTTGEVLEETFAQAFEENPIMAASRYLSLREDQHTGPRLDADSARGQLKAAGLESDIQVGDTGITQAALSTLMERKRIEKRRQETFALSEGGLGQGAARLGISALTSLVDPIGAAANFLPVVGQARYARMLAGARGVLGRAGVRAAVGAAEGAAGAALVEPLTYAMRTQEQADYDVMDSLSNVALGGFLGSGLHSTVGSLADLFVARTGRTPYFERFKDLSQEDAQRVIDLQGQLAKGLSREDALRAVAPWSYSARRAVDDLVPPTLEERIARLPAQDREQLLRRAVNQSAEGQPVNIKAELDAAELRNIDQEIDARLDAREAGLRGTVEGAGADRLTHTYGDVDRQLQDVKRLRDEASATLSADQRQQVREEAKSLARADTQNRYAQDRNREKGGDQGDVIFPHIQEAAETNVARQRALAKEQLTKANDLIASLQQSIDKANQIRGAEIDLSALQTGRRMAQTPRQRLELLPEAIRTHLGRRLDSAEAEARASGAAAAAPPRTVDPEYAGASAAAEKALKDAPPLAPDELPARLDELAGEAESDARELAKRLGIDLEDADMADVAEATAKAERWARAAELATVCLVRGG